jgi:RNA polymerase sigma-70 factor, ECF subfamily
MWLQVREKAMTNEAEGIWYEFHDQLRAFIARRVDNGADVEDILQNVFLRVHQSLGTLNRADRLASWLYQVTRNAIADYYRAAERRREIPTDFTLETEADRDGVQENSGINLLDFEEQRAKAIEELADCLRPMTHRLPAHYRDAISFVELEGLTQREAAEQFGLSVSGMKSRVQRGRQMLKRMLQECCQIHLGPDGRIADYECWSSSCGHCKDNGDRVIANPVTPTV